MGWCNGGSFPIIIPLKVVELNHTLDCGSFIIYLPLHLNWISKTGVFCEFLTEINKYVKEYPFEQVLVYNIYRSISEWVKTKLKQDFGHSLCQLLDNWQYEYGSTSELANCHYVWGIIYPEYFRLWWTFRVLTFYD